MSGQRLWVFLAIVVAAVYGVMVWLMLTRLVPGADGLDPFDARVLGYSVSDARTYLSALSDDARSLYLGPMRVLDTIFPPALALLIAAPIWSKSEGYWCAAVAFPVWYACVDLWENARVSVMLRDPDITDQAIQLASSLTQAKFLLLLLAVLAFALVVVKNARQ